VGDHFPPYFYDSSPIPFFALRTVTRFHFLLRRFSFSFRFSTGSRTFFTFTMHEAFSTNEKQVCRPPW
jgi:hypothetical protein